MRALHLCSLRLFCAVAGSLLLFCLLSLLTPAQTAFGSRADPDIGPAEGAQPFVGGGQMVPLLPSASADVRPFSCPLREGGEGQPIETNHAALPSTLTPQENSGAGQGSPDEDNVVYACTSRRIVRTLDIRVDTPVWEDITPPGIGTIYDCTPDPTMPRLGMWALASSGIWRTYSLASDTPTWQRVRTCGQIKSLWSDIAPLSHPWQCRSAGHIFRSSRLYAARWR